MTNIHNIMFQRRRRRWKVVGILHLETRETKDKAPDVANRVYAERRPRKYSVKFGRWIVRYNTGGSIIKLI